ncbi:MAG: hypothetical protein HKN80_12625 [Acidimicrobiia bacterium]|nr:hypothetical protein [Acidimicrobiia bacterium]
MSATAVYELIGYLGSALIIASLSMKSILRLRLVGLVGATVFSIYGLLIGAIPIVITNAVILGIHAYYLRQLLGSKPVFTVLEVRQGSRYLERFLDHYAEDIAAFQPNFHYEPRPDRYRAFILRDMVPAGLFMCDIDGSETGQVQLDYVIPAYRDLKLGRFLYSSNSSIFADPRITHLESRTGTARHNAYLERMGFLPITGDDGRPAYRLRLADLPGQAGRRSVHD